MCVSLNVKKRPLETALQHDAVSSRQRSPSDCNRDASVEDDMDAWPAESLLPLRGTLGSPKATKALSEAKKALSEGKEKGSSEAETA